MATNISKKSTPASCAQCTNYFSDPRMLPCLHSFCCKCLKILFEEEKIECYLCPTCKLPFEIPDSGVEALPKDLRSIYEADVARYEEKVKSPSGASCDRCIESSESVAVKFCCKCCKFLCKQCTEDHMRRRKTYEHELVEVGEEKEDQNGKGLLDNVPHKVIYCQFHSDEVLKFYCKTCSCLICRDCVVLSHNGHKYERMEKVAEEERSDLMSLLTETDSAGSDLQDAIAQMEKAIQNVKIKQKSVDGHIQEFFKVRYDALRRREENLLEVSSEAGLKKITALTEQTREVKKLHSEIVRTCGKIKNAAQIYTSEEMLSAKAAMAKKLKTLMQQYKDYFLDPCNNESMPVEFDATAVDNEIEKLGVVYGGCYAGGSTASLHIPQAINGRERKIIVVARDQQGKRYPHGGEVVQAMLSLIGSSDFNVKGEIKDNEDGTYVVSITPRAAGEHQLKITIGSEDIKFSPFTISVREPRDYSSLSSSLQQTFSVSSQAWDVAFSNNNNEVFIVDYGYHSIEVKDKSNEHVRTIGTRNSSGSGDAQFYHPTAIAIQGDAIYVADGNNNRIQKLTTSGEFLSKFGESGSGNGQLSNPRGICIDPDGQVYVSEYSNNRISVFKADGTFDRHITGDLSNPWGVAFDPSGNLHVANYNKNSIVVFTPEDKEVTTYGSGIIQRPSGIAIDPEGYVFISEYRSSSSRLTILNHLYEQVHSFQVAYAVGSALDGEGFLYVTDYNNCRVYKY